MAIHSMYTSIKIKRLHLNFIIIHLYFILNIFLLNFRFCNFKQIEFLSEKNEMFLFVNV